MNNRYLPFLFLFLLLFNNGIFAVKEGYKEISNDDGNTSIHQKDSSIAVVGYYCKRDTSWYDLHYKKYSYSNDTVLKADYSEEFMLIVEDSSSLGYKLRYIPLSFEGKSPKDRLFNDLYMREINNVLSRLHCVFYTNDVGEITKIENWQQIRDSLSIHIDSFFDSWFKSDKSMDSTLNKNALASSVKMSLSEDGIRELCHLNKLFLLHGQEYSIGEYRDSTYSNGYPVYLHYDINYLYDKNDSTIRYPFINYISETNLPMNDVSSYLESYMGLIVKEQSPDKQQEIKSSLDSLKTMSSGIMLSNVARFILAENGWPLNVIIKNSSKIGDYMGQDEIYEIDNKRISWWNY
jgi:hypothetical protein